jgi:PPOX class probable F420-dependent enzyme
LEQFSGRRYINLESYKKNGEPKRTPVQSLEHDGLIYVRTGPSTWKVKRIRRNSHVRVVLSDRSGKPIGEWVEGEALLLEGAEKDRMMELFKKAYGSVGYALVNLVGRLRGERMTAVISIKLKER